MKTRVVPASELRPEKGLRAEDYMKQAKSITERQRVSFEEICMRMAGLLIGRSTCDRLQVGCVIASSDYRKILAWGYNGNASGLPNKCDSDEPGKCGCFVEGTLVYPAGLSLAYRRRYEGEVIRVITTAGDFTVTPNHPVLAAGTGWTPAKSLHEGSYLIGTAFGEDALPTAPHYKEAVPIEQAFETLAVSEGLGIRCSGASHQFHGDGLVGEDVDVVSIHGALESHIDANSLKDLGEPPLPTAHIVASELICPSPGDVCVAASSGEDSSIEKSAVDDDAADSVISSERGGRLSSKVSIDDLRNWKVDHALSLVPAEVLGHLSEDPGFAQAVLDGGVGNTKVLSDVCNALTAPVTAHKVLHAERYRWSGHVYNLHTDQNWYSLQTGGILAHNCLHAEENAVINCDSPRQWTKIVFCTHLPCKMCAKRLVNLGGVVKLYYATDYRLHEGLALLSQAGIPYEQMEIRW